MVAGLERSRVYSGGERQGADLKPFADRRAMLLKKLSASHVRTTMYNRMISRDSIRTITTTRNYAPSDADLQAFCQEIKKFDVTIRGSPFID